MAESPECRLIAKCYSKSFGAAPQPNFAEFFHRLAGPATSAVLGYRRASHGALFLEAYLDQPIEQILTHALGRVIARDRIVELGNLAASNAVSMVEIWGTAANDLGDTSEVAVATLTAPLRKMFARIGLPLIAIAPADPARLGGDAAGWGQYYQNDPQICAGLIAEGQKALAAYLLQRKRRLAA